MKSPLLILAALLAAIPAAASAQDHCSRETLSVRSTPVTITYCISAPAAPSTGGELVLPVDATYSTPGHSFSRSAVLRFVSGEAPARTLENVPLAGLGLTGTLHLTLIYTAGAVHIESAMLTPGAVTIK